jgi:hypothetical protein
MNRQELFHGDSPLIPVSRAEQGYRGASNYFPPLCHYHEPNKNTSGCDVFTYHTLVGIPYLTYDSIKNYRRS